MGDRLGTPGAVGFSSLLGHIWWGMLLIPLLLVFQGCEHLVMSAIMSINSCYYEPQVTHSNENFSTILSLFSLSLLGLMAKIKCSICSYQFNIWYAGHSPAQILIWFLSLGLGSEVYLTLTTGCLGIALQPSAAHWSFIKKLKTPLNFIKSSVLHDKKYILASKRLNIFYIYHLKWAFIMPRLKLLTKPKTISLQMPTTIPRWIHPFSSDHGS